jgi:phosphatidylglycerophosphate synthase
VAQGWKKLIPWLMVLFRASLAPLVPLVAWRLASPQLLLGCLIAAGFLSDVYDGILARRWGTATDALRLADTVVDLLFYLGVLAAIILRHGPVLGQRLGLLVAVLALESGRMIFELVKFHRIASYHTYAAKMWGILLAAATLALLCFDRAYWLTTLALAWGLVCDTEGLIMSILLPRWERDVKSFVHALRLRRELLGAINALQPPP